MNSENYTKGLVSIVIPTYNRADIIMPSIKSVRDQTYKKLEIIVVDDGSTDNTRALIQSFSKEDPRIIYVLNEGVKGAAGARNTGIEAAHGEFIAFEDSDDLFVADKIQKQLDELKTHPDCNFCYTRFRKEMPDNRYFVFPQLSYTYDELSGDIYQRLLYDNTIGCPTLMIRHAYLDDIGLFDIKMAANEDYDLAIRLSQNSPAAFIDEVLLISSTTPESLSLDVRKDLGSFCYFILKYKKELIKAGTLNHRLEQVLTDAQRYGLLSEIEPILEKIITL